jgi:signal transduction histidine kinase
VDAHDEQALTVAQEELRRERERADALAARLQDTLREIDALTRAVSHDLRAPLRAIQGFAQIALEECGAALPDEGRDHLRRVSLSARRMSDLIDGLAGLSRIDHAGIHQTVVDLGALSRSVWQVLERADPGRAIRFMVDERLEVSGDRRLLRIALDQLLQNARKFTVGTATPSVTVGRRQMDGETVFFVADNGAGFNPAYTSRLFTPFQRLHPESEFPGRGVGLSAVHRVIRRHGGRVWAEGAVACGATVFFTLPSFPADVR